MRKLIILFLSTHPAWYRACPGKRPNPVHNNLWTSSAPPRVIPWSQSCCQADRTPTSKRRLFARGLPCLYDLYFCWVSLVNPKPLLCHSKHNRVSSQLKSARTQSIRHLGRPNDICLLILYLTGELRFQILVEVRDHDYMVTLLYDIYRISEIK